jgi:hypothetical protein
MICSPKIFGGLGVKNLRLLNLALRTRWRWLELEDQGKPWKGLQFALPQQAEEVFRAAISCQLGDGQRLKFWVDPWIQNRSVAQFAPNLMKHIKPASLQASVAQALPGNEWAHMIKGTPSVQALVEYMDLWEAVSSLHVNEELPDAISWRLTPNAAYSAKSAYNMFFIGRIEMPGAKELWTAGAPLKHKIHMWLALKDRLWTADRLARRGLQHPPLCTLCCQEEETVEHLTLQCSFSREVWYHVLLPLRMHRHTPAADDRLSTWWPALSNATPKKHRKEMNSLVILVARELWLERNSRVFDKAAVLPAELVRTIKEKFLLWRTAKLCGSGDQGGIT